MRKTRCGFAALVALVFGLLTAAVCVCLAQGPADSRKAAPATVSGKSLPDEATGPSPKSHGLTPEKQMLQRAERRAQLQTELENLRLDEQILELNQQKQKLHDQQRREQYQRQADLAKLDEKMQEVNQERTASKRNTDGRIRSLKKRSWNLMQKSKN